MKKYFIVLIFFSLFTSIAYSQKVKSEDVPVAVRSALTQKYPDAKNVHWEKEKGNYEANWGGKSGEDNSVQFTPSGNFIEIVKAIPVSSLPKPVFAYIKEHYSGAKVTEAGRVTDSMGKIFFEAEVNKKDLLFDENGNFIRSEE